MDGLIKRFDAVRDDDLMLCLARGVAYQRDMKSARVSYDDSYFDCYAKLEGQEIARKLNAGRVEIVNKHVGPDTWVLDVGVGSGEFIKNRRNTLGHDVNKKAIVWLRENHLWSQSLEGFPAYTFWDVLEHVDVPNNYFKRMADGCLLFTSLPTFEDLNRVRESRHYKPGEHLYYFTEEGFIDWMSRYRFRLLERSRFETDAGRDGITSFVFKRDLPSYHQTVEQYRRLYEPNYGATAYLYFDQIAAEVLSLQPSSVLDYGCGRSDLVAHFWNDGGRRIAKYDPAIPRFETMPADDFDLVLCTDVMEHILMQDVDHILSEIRAKSRNALFTISLRPARAKLPDGRNAHVTLLSPGEWLRWIEAIFGRAVHVPIGMGDHLMMVKTWA